MNERYWVYHPKHEAKIVVGSSDYYKHLDDGWFDNPAKCTTGKMEEITGEKGGLCAPEKSEDAETEQVKRRGRPPKEQ